MGSSVVLDLDALAQPISAESLTGMDLRDDLSPTSPYQELKELRGSARAAERNGDFEAVIGRAEAGAWHPMVPIATRALEESTKDLEITAWLIEALLRTEGFGGLRDGLRLARRLVENFWDSDLYPMPDEDGIETRVNPLAGLNGVGGNGTLLAPISRVPVTSSSQEPFATWTLRQSQELEHLDAETVETRVESGVRTIDQVRAAVQETPPQFFVDLVEDLEECLSELAQLTELLDEKCGSDSPSTGDIRDALVQVLDTVRYHASSVLPSPSEPAPMTDGDASTESAPQAGTALREDYVIPGPVQSREDAFRMLSNVADFFHRTEPHSPIPFLLQRAIRWGNLHLPDLLNELIPDDGARFTYEQLTGVEGTGQPDDE